MYTHKENYNEVTAKWGNNAPTKYWRLTNLLVDQSGSIDFQTSQATAIALDYLQNFMVRPYC